MRGEKLKATVLGISIIHQVDERLKKELGLLDEDKRIGIIST